MRLWAPVLILAMGFEATAGDSTSAQTASVRQAPKVLNGKDRNVGRYIPDLEFQDVSGKSHQLGEFANRKAVVIAVTSTSCPLSKKYFPTLLSLASKYQAQGISFVLVNPTATDKAEAVKKDAAQLGSKGIYVHDVTGAVSSALGLTSTTDVILLDPARTVQYHGAVDDQYGFGYAIEAPRKSYLISAIDEFLKGHPVVITATEAPGCHLDVGAGSTPTSSVTYHNRISRIIQKNCGECHREGGVGPFALETRADLIAHAKMIETVVTQKTMPPFFAVPSEKAPSEKSDTSASSSSPWINDCSLSESDQTDLLAWLKGDRVEGDAKDAPLPTKYKDGWTIGKPDLVYKFPQPVPVQATGIMKYKNVVVDTGLQEDKWIQAIEIHPGAPEVVHHILVFARAGLGDRRGGPLDDINYWAIYVPGNNKQIYPEGFARKLPKGSQIRFQMHYTPNGTATEDSTEIGLVFADRPPSNEVKTTSLINAWFEIPPGADNHPDAAKVKLPSDLTVMGFLPHMHLRGKSCRYEAVMPDGTRETLLDIPHYDFNWQLMYRYAEPRTFTKGTTLKFTAWFDNSSKNPANPNPKSTVRWGEQTYDEMLLGYVEYFVPLADSHDQSDIDERIQSSLKADRDEMLFSALDDNDDEKLSLEEVKKLGQNPRFKQANPLMLGVFFASLDKDKDGSLSLDEFRNIRQMFQNQRKK